MRTHKNLHKYIPSEQSGDDEVEKKYTVTSINKQRNENKSREEMQNELIRVQ